MWRSAVLEALHERNRSEQAVLGEIILANSACQEQIKTLYQENRDLDVNNAKLRQENIELHAKAPLLEGDALASKLQGKILSLQEEITDLLRTKHENAQEVIDLRNLAEKNKVELQVRDTKVEEQNVLICDLKEKIRDLMDIIREKDSALNLQRDEHTALQLIYNKLLEEFEQKLGSIIDIKNQQAIILNQEIEENEKRRSRTMTMALQEAAEEATVEVQEEPIELPPLAVVPQSLIKKFDAHEGGVHAVQWSNSGRFFATGGDDRWIRLWNFDGREVHPRCSLSGSNKAIMSIAFDSEDEYLLAACKDHSARVWKLSDQRLRNTLTGHSDKALAAKFYHNAQNVVTASKDRTLKLWDLRQNGCIKTIFCNSSATDVVISDDAASTLISSHFDCKLRFWDMRGTCREPMIVPLDDRITSLDLSQDGSKVLCCLRNNTLNVVDVRTNETICTVSDDDFILGGDWTRARFGGDAAYIVVGGNDGHIFIWDALTGVLKKKMKKHSSPVYCTSWSNQGDYVLSSERDKKVCLWGP